MNEQIVMTIGNEFLGLQVGKNVSLWDFFEEKIAEGFVRLSPREAADCWLLFPLWALPPTWRGRENVFTGKTTTSLDGECVLHEVITVCLQQDPSLGIRLGSASWVTTPNLKSGDIVLMKKKA